MTQYRVLLVPDSIYWVTGTIAKSIAAANTWMDATILSATVLDDLLPDPAEIARRFDLVHFLCPYATKKWLPLLKPLMPVVTSHHHVTSWDLVSHNTDGDAIIAGSEEWVSDLNKRGADMDRVFRVPYGVDTDMFAPATPERRRAQKAQTGLANAEPVIGFFAKRASNDDDRKGTALFAEAVMQLRERLPRTGVLIVGPGWQQMVAQFRDAGITCAWMPFVEDLADIPRLYHALDFYWVTARVEGGPVPLLEAMSSGVCCLTTRVGLAREVVKDGLNAFFQPMDQPSAFALATETLWKDAGVRAQVGRAARDTMVKEMRWQETAKLVVDAYSRAIEEFSRRARGRSVIRLPHNAAVAAKPDATIRVDALTPRETRRASLLEDLAWAENLILYQNQRGAAMRLVAKAWRKNPLSHRPARVMLRRLLPEPVVKSVVRLRRVISKNSPKSARASPSDAGNPQSDAGNPHSGVEV